MVANKVKIQINLFDVNSIDKAIAQLNLEKRKLDNRVDLFLRKLAEAGVEIAKAKVVKYNAVFTAELLNSIHVEPKKDGVYAIVSDSEHTAFVEFGTGMYGEMNPYPYFSELETPISWQYNSPMSEHLQFASETFMWGDQVIQQGTYYWFYFKNGRWHLSQGMRARPFMYETYLGLNKSRLIRSIAKEVFTDA